VVVVVVPAAGQEEEEGEEGAGYTRAGHLFYRTEWKPRDCVGNPH